MRKKPYTDPAFVFFGVVALACLTVSIPATLIAMELFHGETWGKPAVIVFEIGAVGAELATIAIPQWRKRLMALTIVLLLATTGTNYAHGADLFVASTLPRSYAAVRDAGLGWAMAIVAAGLFPALLFVFLTAFTARWRMLRGGYDTPLKAFSFWLGVFWIGMNTRLSDSEQARALAEQRALDYEQQATEARALAERQAGEYEHRLAALRMELSTRPAPVEVEIVRIARYELTYEQAARFLELCGARNASVSTVRRRLPELIEQNGRHP